MASAFVHGKLGDMASENFEKFGISPETMVDLTNFHSVVGRVLNFTEIETN
jgi:hypothetical protein